MPGRLFCHIISAFIWSIILTVLTLTSSYSHSWAQTLNLHPTSSSGPNSKEINETRDPGRQVFDQRQWRLSQDFMGQLCLLAYSDIGFYVNAPVCFKRDLREIRFDGLATFSSVAAPISGGAAGPTFSAHNVGLNGAVGLLGQYFSAANGKGFDLGAEFIATFNPVTWQEGNNGKAGPGDMAQWIVAMSPNDVSHNWGTNIVEYNIVNRGPDKGWRRDRGLQPVTGGLVVVAEASVFGDPGGGEGKNALYGYTAARSSSVNSTGLPVKFYNDFLCEPNSAVGLTGRCLYATGDITGVSSQVPYAPVQIDGSWLHGFDTTNAVMRDNLALRMRSGQTLGFVSDDGKTASLASEVIEEGINLSLAPSGLGRVIVKGDSAISGLLTAGALQVTGHVDGAGGGLPTVSDGIINERSTDTRGIVTLKQGSIRAIVTFATPFRLPPFCVLTGSRTESTKAITSTDLHAMVLEVSKNELGETLTWHCMQ